MARGRIPYVLLITALLSLPVYFLRDEMDTEEIKMHRYWIGKTHHSKKYPVLFGGDSRTFRGISPDHFAAEFDGYQAYNYAYWSNGMGRVYLEGIGKMVDLESDRKVIVLGVSPHSLTDRAAQCRHYLAEKQRSKEEVLQHYYLSVFSEYFAPYSLREVRRKLTGKSKPSNYRISYHQNGWVESFWIKPDTGYSAQFYETIFTDNMVSEEVIGTLLDFVERWTAMGITVAGFRPPTSQTIRKLEKELGGFDEEVFVKLFTGAGGLWIDVRNDFYQTYDGNHLEHQSAMRISGDLGRMIREQMK